MPDTPETPARLARRTKALSNETNAALAGLLLNCIASARSIPCAMSPSAAASDGSSSTCTFLRPSTFVKALRMAPSSNPYALRRTQSVSRNTVFAIQIGPAANSVRASADCLGSSPVSNRTRMLVSTAVMTARHLPANGGAHLRERLRFALVRQAAGHLVETGIGETAGGAEQNSAAGLFDRELRPQRPRLGSTYALRQNDLPLGRKPRGFHR